MSPQNFPTEGWDAFYWFLVAGAAAASILGVLAVCGLVWAIHAERGNSP